MSKVFPVSHVLPEASLFLEFIFLFNLKNSAQIYELILNYPVRKEKGGLMKEKSTKV